MKVLIIPDTPGWSCDFTSGYIVKHLPHIEFTKRYMLYINDKRVIEPGDDYDAVWLMLHYSIGQVLSQLRGAGLNDKTNFLMGIRGPLGFNRTDTFPYDQLTAIGVQSKWAYREMKLRVPEYNDLWITYDGVDEKVFRPMPELRPPDDEFIVGWAGQDRFDLKRFKVIQEMCRPYETNFAVCNAPLRQFAIPHDKMPEYYNSLSAFIHFSTKEGAPRPVIEAAACGIPVVTSPTGYGQEVIDESMHAPDRIKAQQLLSMLNSNPSLRKEIGNRNREEVLKNWTWTKRAPRYEEFFRQEGNTLQSIGDKQV